MRVMVFVKATANSEKGMVKDPQTMKMLEEMGKYNDELKKARVEELMLAQQEVAFAKAKQNPRVAAESLAHLRRYLEGLLDESNAITTQEIS